MNAKFFTNQAKSFKREQNAPAIGFDLGYGFAVISSVAAVRILSVILSIIGIISLVRVVGTGAT